jgi:hypothetical protein
MGHDGTLSGDAAAENIVGRTAVSATIGVELDRDSRFPTRLSTVRSTDTELLESGSRTPLSQYEVLVRV